MYTIGMIA